MGGNAPGVLPPQGGAVPMPIKAAGDHAVSLDKMISVMKVIRDAIPGFGDSKEGICATEMLIHGAKCFSVQREGGKEDTVDPMQRVTQAILARRAMNKAPMAGGPPPGMPPGAGSAPPPMPLRGPVPMPTGGAPR